MKKTPQIDFPDWLENKLKTVHGKPGSGSIFSNVEKVKDQIMKVVLKNMKNIHKIANSSSTIQETIPKIGYDLVLPYKEALALPNSIETTVKKLEGNNEIEVPAFKTSEPIERFSTDQLTIIIKPKKDSDNNIVPDEYIILSAWPGRSVPRASEWNGKYAVIIPDQKISEQKKQKTYSKLILARWKKITGIE